MEISNTDDFAFRQGLKADEVLIKALLERLRQAHGAGQEGQPARAGEALTRRGRPEHAAGPGAGGAGRPHGDGARST